MPRRFRVFAAVLALASLLFTQLAVAGYLCPSMQLEHAMEAAATAAAHNDMAGCEGMDDTDKPVSCHDHNQTGNQSLDKPELPNVAPFVATVLVQAVAGIDPPLLATSPPLADLLLARATAPPLSIRNCCFRI
jgi:hypothetical protein